MASRIARKKIRKERIVTESLERRARRSKYAAKKQKQAKEQEKHT